MLDFLQPVIDVFVVIGNFLNDILNGIMGCIGIIVNLIDILIDIARILPHPLYSTFIIFGDLYFIIFTYKIIRKG